ncbi:MAG TPA: STAS domain-containing protein [Tepidisphaeraceae bacterium]|jgi:anti-anti-sigma factor
MPDDINVVEIDGVTVISIELESLMGMREVDRLAAEVEGQLNHGVTKLVLDFQKVRYAGSAALGVMIATLKRMKANNGQMILANAGAIAPLLKVARTQALFTTANNLNEAVRMLQPR